MPDAPRRWEGNLVVHCERDCRRADESHLGSLLGHTEVNNALELWGGLRRVVEPVWRRVSTTRDQAAIRMKR